MKSITASATGRPPIVGRADQHRVAQTGRRIAACEPLGVRPRVDELERVGRLAGSRAISANVPSSTSCTIRSRAVTGKW